MAFDRTEGASAGRVKPGAEAAERLIRRCRALLGRRHVLTGARATRRYRLGYRYGGSGEVLAVLRPGTLVEQWRVLEACVEAGVIVIFQAANTGLTGGSTPCGEGYDRPVVIINAMRIARVDLLSDGAQVLCLPGATLDRLEQALRPLGREPHSVIGSSCLGASVTGGICNNSGGALIRRGPAYTQLALFAQIDADGRLRLRNNLGIDLGTEPEEILARLDAQAYGAADLHAAAELWASDRDYDRHVREVDAATPARFNADPRRLYEASGSAGRLAVFALRLDTFPADRNSRMFYIGTNDPAELTAIRRHILGTFEALPISGEYMNRAAYDMTQRYGKDIFLFLRHVGSDHIPRAFAAKSWFEGLSERIGLGSALSDRLLQATTDRLPEHLPERMNTFRDRYAHHLMLKMGDDGICEAREYLGRIFPSASGNVFECTEAEAEAAQLHRFAFGAAAGRCKALNRERVEGILALDVALPRNERDWLPELPPDLDAQLLHKGVCGHFFCHVLHQDYMVKKGCDVEAVKSRLLELLDRRGAEYPAEHNVGHIYPAKPALRAFYQRLDPTNTLNPGIGRTSRLRDWG